MKKKLSAIWTILLCVLLLLAGCSGSAGPSKAESSETVDAQSQATEEEDSEATAAAESGQAPASTLIEPEQLISQEEAEAFLGEPLVGEKKENSAVGQKIMFYKAVNENSFQYLQIAVTQQAFMPEGSSSTPESIYKSVTGAFEAEAVTGLGDEAQVIPSGYEIMCDGYYLEVTAGYTTDDAGIMSEASKTAVNNLKALLGK